MSSPATKYTCSFSTDAASPLLAVFCNSPMAARVPGPGNATDITTSTGWLPLSGATGFSSLLHAANNANEATAKYFITFIIRIVFKLRLLILYITMSELHLYLLIVSTVPGLP